MFVFLTEVDFLKAPRFDFDLKTFDISCTHCNTDDDHERKSELIDHFQDVKIEQEHVHKQHPVCTLQSCMTNTLASASVQRAITL